MTSGLHERSIFIDACSPLLEDPTYIDLYIKGGVTAVAPTIAVEHSAEEALARMGAWHCIARERGDVIVVQKAADIERAKAEGKIGIIFHFQNIGPLHARLDLVDGFGQAGVKIIMLTYNERGVAGDGCEEPSDAGLSRFGHALVERLETARIIVDCSHTGRRTTKDAIRHATRPIVVSHANALAVQESPRNLDDETIRMLADKGGLVGAVAFPPFISSNVPPTMAEFAAHVRHMVNVGGEDHVGLGLDFYGANHPFMEDAAADRIYRRNLASGRWSHAYPSPPWKFPAEFATPDLLPGLTEGLLASGLSERVVEKVIGANWMRVYRDIWG